MDVTVTDLPDQSRYEATSADSVVGVLEYKRKDGVIFLNHAETSLAHRGQGIAAQLVLKAMQDASEQGVKVVPVCPYVRNWVSQHPEWG
jgi:predicted GNAT family acetyltransferase